MKTLTLTLFSTLLLLACQNNSPTPDQGGTATSKTASATQPARPDEVVWEDLLSAGPEAFVKKGGAGQYEFQDGVLIGKSRPKTQNTFLCTKKRYRDFEMVYDFKVDPRLNSGVQFRSNIKILKNGRERVWGYQCEIDPSPRAYSAGVYEEAGRGWLSDLKENKKAREAFKPGEWNHVRILAVGKHIQTWINGVKATDFEDERTAEGFFGFQVHNVPFKEEAHVQWRKARVRTVKPH